MLCCYKGIEDMSIMNELAAVILKYLGQKQNLYANVKSTVFQKYKGDLQILKMAIYYQI